MKPRRGPRKIITRVIVFLLLGAIVNVAVAWGCAIYIAKTPLRYWEGLDRPDREWVDWHLGDVRLSDNEATRVVSHRAGIGVDVKTIAITKTDIEVITTPHIPLAAITLAGFPCRSLIGGRIFWMTGGHSLVGVVVHRRVPDDIDIPVTAVPSGFAINTIFYAAILWLLFFVPGSVRRTLRHRRGLCPACAYPVGTSPVCTECGRAVSQYRRSA